MLTIGNAVCLPHRAVKWLLDAGAEVELVEEEDASVGEMAPSPLPTSDDVTSSRSVGAKEGRWQNDATSRLPLGQTPTSPAVPRRSWLHVYDETERRSHADELQGRLLVDQVTKSPMITDPERVLLQRRVLQETRYLAQLDEARANLRQNVLLRKYVLPTEDWTTWPPIQPHVLDVIRALALVPSLLPEAQAMEQSARRLQTDHDAAGLYPLHGSASFGHCLAATAHLADDQSEVAVDLSPADGLAHATVAASESTDVDAVLDGMDAGQLTQWWKRRKPPTADTAPGPPRPPQKVASRGVGGSSAAGSTMASSFSYAHSNAVRNSIVGNARTYDAIGGVQNMWHAETLHPAATSAAAVRGTAGPAIAATGVTSAATSTSVSSSETVSLLLDARSLINTSRSLQLLFARSFFDSHHPGNGVQALAAPRANIAAVSSVLTRHRLLSVADVLTRLCPGMLSTNLQIALSITSTGSAAERFDAPWPPLSDPRTLPGASRRVRLRPGLWVTEVFFPDLVEISYRSATNPSGPLQPQSTTTSMTFDADFFATFFAVFNVRFAVMQAQGRIRLTTTTTASVTSATSSSDAAKGGGNPPKDGDDVIIGEYRVKRRRRPVAAEVAPRHEGHDDHSADKPDSAMVDCQQADDHGPWFVFHGFRASDNFVPYRRLIDDIRVRAGIAAANTAGTNSTAAADKGDFSFLLEQDSVLATMSHMFETVRAQRRQRAEAMPAAVGGEASLAAGEGMSATTSLQAAAAATTQATPRGTVVVSDAQLRHHVIQLISATEPGVTLRAAVSTLSAPAYGSPSEPQIKRVLQAVAIFDKSARTYRLR